jgi:hypothetical protein
MAFLAPLLFVFAVSGAAVAGLLFVRRRLNPASLSKHNDVAGAIFSIVGTLYAVLLAFVVIIVWEAMGTADERAALEAGTLGDVIRDTSFLQSPEREEMRKHLHEYTQAIIDDEWAAMNDGGSSPRVWDAADRIFETFSTFTPETPRDINVHGEMLRRLNDLSDHRRLRLLSATNKGPALMWGLLIIGGVITLGFSYFLGVERERAHALMVGALAAMIGLTLYLIIAIDHPYGGVISVEPDAFRLAIGEVERGISQ